MTLSKEEKNEMVINVLQMLQSPAKSMQKLGLELMQANKLDCEEWFNALDEIYEITYGKKSESKDDLLDLFNEKVLSLSSKKLSDLPKSIGLLAYLEELYLHKNQLTSIPSEVGALTNLKRLDLHDNQLTSIPLELGKLVNLEELSLENNKIPKSQIKYLQNKLPLWCIISL